MANERPDFLVVNFGNDWLSSMHEISLPAAVAWLPQGPFWSALLLMACAGLSVYLWRVYRRYCSNHYRRQALARLQKISLQWKQQSGREKACRDLALLIRRVALTAWPRTDSASLVGQSWLEFLHKSAPIDAPPALLSSLSSLPASQLHAMPETQWQELTQWVADWLIEHTPQSLEAVTT